MCKTKKHISTSGLAMAAASMFQPQLSKKVAVDSGNFEAEVKTRLSWTRNKWEREGQENSRMCKLVHSLKYWAKKLEKSFRKNNVVLTVFNEERFEKLEFFHIVDAVIALEENIFIEGFAVLENPRYISVSFRDEKSKLFIENNLKSINGSNVAFLKWGLEDVSWDINVSWLPLEVDIEDTKSMLQSHFDILEQERHSVTLMNGQVYPLGKVSFKGVLKKGVTIADVPHGDVVQGLDCLILIPGRPIKCFNCSLLGHKAKDCPTPFCQRCKRNKASSHQCGDPTQRVGLYADVVKLGSKEDGFSIRGRKWDGKEKVVENLGSEPSGQQKAEAWREWSQSIGEESDLFTDTVGDQKFDAVSKLKGYLQEFDKKNIKKKIKSLGGSEQLLRKSSRVSKKKEAGDEVKLTHLVDLKRKLKGFQVVKGSVGKNARYRSVYGKKSIVVDPLKCENVFDVLEDLETEAQASSMVSPND